jgi:hypothetical protein
MEIERTPAASEADKDMTGALRLGRKGILVARSISRVPVNPRPPAIAAPFNIVNFGRLRQRRGGTEHATTRCPQPRVGHRTSAKEAKLSAHDVMRAMCSHA